MYNEITSLEPHFVLLGDVWKCTSPMNRLGVNAIAYEHLSKALRHDISLSELMYSTHT